MTELENKHCGIKLPVKNETMKESEEPIKMEIDEAKEEPIKEELISDTTVSKRQSSNSGDGKRYKRVRIYDSSDDEDEQNENKMKENIKITENKTDGDFLVTKLEFPDDQNKVEPEAKEEKENSVSKPMTQIKDKKNKQIKSKTPKNQPSIMSFFSKKPTV